LVLSRPDILRYLSEGRLKLDPPVSDDAVAQVSIDLQLGRKFSRFKDPPKWLPAVRVDQSLWKSDELWDHHEQDEFRLEPGAFVLAQTLQSICIPNDLMGFVEGRSSWARVGITIHVTAPKIDPGFEGTVTLEMANFGKVAVDLRAQVDRPAQLLLFRVSQPLDSSAVYGCGKDDVFQYQADPVPHREKA